MAGGVAVGGANPEVTCPGTFRFLFYPPEGYRYFSFAGRVAFDAAARGFVRGNGAWEVDLAMLAYGQDGERRMGWAGVAERLAEAGFARRTAIGDWERRGTQAFVAERPEFAALAFRGTEPGDWTDVLLDLGVLPSAEQWESGVPGKGTMLGVAAALEKGVLVHGGFQRALNAVWAEVAVSAGQLPAGLPLVLCGHSMGGALAFLAASRMAGRDNPVSLYTFGAPRVGNGPIGERVLRITEGRAYRVVNGRDAVTMVPTGAIVYAHAPSAMIQLSGDGSAREAPESGEGAAGAVTGALSAVAEFARRGGALDAAVRETAMEDHSPCRYLALSAF